MNSTPSIVQGTNKKPVASRSLVNFFATTANLSGELFVGYPIIGSPEGRYPIDAVWVSQDKGIVVFDLIEGTDISGFMDRQDDAANKLESRLKAHRELMNRRTLAVPINTISFAPGIQNFDDHDNPNYILATLYTLESALQRFSWEGSSLHYYLSTISALQNISTIRKNKINRLTTREDSRGAKLKRLENSIATLDNLQGKAVIETVKGVQRIRGLAGSGKTIVLALKAAYLHAQHPDWKIAVTFHTRALKGQLKRLIYTFSIEQTGEEPDWNKLNILNAWGAPGGGEREGIYHQFCRSVDAPYYDFRSAGMKFGKANEFSSVCNEALSYTSTRVQLYDAILIDEAQDFPPSFLRLCYEILDAEKRLVYAYDELQNLSGKSLQSPEEIFGKKTDGTPRVTFPEPVPGEPRSDIILEKCYRNSRPVLVTAHALGFGIYRQPPPSRSTGLVQMFDESELWKEIGYEVKSGELKEGKDVVLQRKPEASPSFLEDHSPIDDLIQFLKFDSVDEQNDWVVQEIAKNLQEDELRYDDIVVINPDPLKTRKAVGSIRRRLFEIGINSHLAGIDTDPDVFFQSDLDSITFTGIYRAKGNEAGMVYIVNAHDCHSSFMNLSTIRNRLFTAITRSKAWVRVIGVGNSMQSLIDEFNTLKELNFELNFRYPTQNEREKLSIVHRDMTDAERNRLINRKKDFRELINDLENGNIKPEDLDDDLIVKLGELLKKRDF